MLIVHPQEGKRVLVGGLVLTIKIPSSASDGRYSLVEWDVKPVSRTPIITLKKSESTIYVTEGRFEFQHADRSSILEPGAAAHVPQNTRFALKNPRKARSTFLCLVSPGGFDEYADELSRILLKKDPGIAEQLRELSDRYDIQLMTT
jgi:quercetin dioxygenase-like cupin family protein